MKQRTYREKNSPRSAYLGLNDHYRVSWNDEYNRACMALVNLGFSIEVIARHTGLTRSQVMYRCRKRNASVLAYRNGTSSRALTILHRYLIAHPQKVVG